MADPMMAQINKDLIFSPVTIYLASPRFPVLYFLPARSTLPAAPGKYPNIEAVILLFFTHTNIHCPLDTYRISLILVFRVSY